MKIENKTKLPASSEFIETEIDDPLIKKSTTIDEKKKEAPKS